MRTMLQFLLVPFTILIAQLCISTKAEYMNVSESLKQNSEQLPNSPLNTTFPYAGNYSQIPISNLSGEKPITIAKPAGIHSESSASYYGYVPKLVYFGGPVVANVKIVTIWWGTGVQYTTQLEKFYSAVTDSSWFRSFREYSTPSIPIGVGSWLRSYSDTTAPSGNITDSQIQARLKSLIANGSIPAPDANTYYAIHFKPGITIKLGAASSCEHFCAYHGTIANTGGSSKYFYYGVIPDQGGACAGGCGHNANPFNNLCSVASHELAETVTDPAVGVVTNVGYPMGWYDPVLGENGDICNHRQGSTVGSDGVTYTVQTVWSNHAKKCISSALPVVKKPTRPSKKPTKRPRKTPSKV